VDAAPRGWTVQNPPPGVPVLASWGRRVCAYVLDTVITFLPYVVAFPLLLLGDEQESDALLAVGVVLFVLGLLLHPVYFTVAHGRESGQTLGKRWLGLRVVDAQTGGRIGYGRSFGRWLIGYLCWNSCVVPGILDALWPLWDQQRQSWHDKVATSVVVRLPA
jgi:uncharacterized RDD family membrane protein YckC